MLSRSKFKSLKEITRYFRISDELEKFRDDLISGKVPDTEALKSYNRFLQDFKDPPFVKELTALLNQTHDRKKIEGANFLYHKIKEHFGYPVPESKFVKSLGDSEKPRGTKTELIVVLENLRSAHNVGSIIRSCECFGVKKLLFCGITPGTENPKTLKTSKESEKGVDCERYIEVSEAISVLRKEGYRIVCAETGSGAINLKSYTFLKKTALIFGNEELGVIQETLELCDDIVCIELSGFKNSLNVSNCASIFMYDYNRKVF